MGPRKTSSHRRPSPPPVPSSQQQAFWMPGVVEGPVDRVSPIKVHWTKQPVGLIWENKNVFGLNLYLLIHRFIESLLKAITALRFLKAAERFHQKKVKGSQNFDTDNRQTHTRTRYTLPPAAPDTFPNQPSSNPPLLTSY